MAKWFLKNHDFIHVNSSVAGKYNKHKQDGSHLGFPIRMILAFDDLQVTSILPMNFESIDLSVQEKEFKTDFQDGRHGANWDFLSLRFELYFFIYKSHRCFLPSLSLGLSVQKKKGKTDFQDGRHLGFPIGTILAIFIPTSHPDASYQFSNQLALWFRKISEKKKSFKRAAMAAILDFRSKQLKLFLIYKSLQCFLPSFESNGLSVQKKKRFSRWLS